jgi:hypothetical protein
MMAWLHEKDSQLFLWTTDITDQRQNWYTKINNKT